MSDATVHALADHLILHGREVTVDEEELADEIKDQVDKNTRLTVQEVNVASAVCMTCEQ